MSIADEREGGKPVWRRVEWEEKFVARRGLKTPRKFDSLFPFRSSKRTHLSSLSLSAPSLSVYFCDLSLSSLFASDPLQRPRVSYSRAFARLVFAILFQISMLCFDSGVEQWFCLLLLLSLVLFRVRSLSSVRSSSSRSSWFVM